MLKTVSNSCALLQVHTIPIERLCPVSGNPEPGSYLRLEYQTVGAVLDVVTLAPYCAQFVHSPEYRDLELVVIKTANDAAGLLGVTVHALGYFLLADRTTLEVRYETH